MKVLNKRIRVTKNGIICFRSFSKVSSNGIKKTKKKVNKKQFVHCKNTKKEFAKCFKQKFTKCNIRLV